MLNIPLGEDRWVRLEGLFGFARRDFELHYDDHINKGELHEVVLCVGDDVVLWGSPCR